MNTAGTITACLRAASVVAGLILLPTSAVADFASDLKKAIDWGYTAQRNVAFSYQSGDGVAQNLVEACAWRSVVAFGRGIDVSDSDITHLEGCHDRGLQKEAAGRAASIVKTLRPRPPRSVQLDLDDLAAEACDEGKCSARFDRFADLYKAAIRGETAAIRELARCYLSADCSPDGMNGFQGCLWTLELMRVVGERDAPLRSQRSIHCGSSPTAKVAIDHHLAAIRQMRSAP